MNIYREMKTHIRNFPAAFWVVIGATLINQAGNMALVFLVLYLHQALHFSLALSSFSFAVNSIGMLVSGLIGGTIIDRTGAARLIPISLFANGLGLMIFPFLHHYPSILLLCFFWGFCFGLFRPASQTFVSQLSTPGIHKITFSIYRLAINLGMSVGPAIGGYLAYHSFSAIFFANGTANLLAATVFLFGLSRTHSFQPMQKNLARKIELSVKWIKHDAALRIFVLGMLPVGIIFFQHESTLAIFLNRDLHFPLSFYGLLFTINTLMIVFFELALNVATMHWTYRTHFFLGTFFITLGFAGLLFASQEWHVVLLTISWTLGEMIFFPSASSYIAEIAPESLRGSYMSVFATCSNLGMLLGPWGGALVMQQWGAHGLWLACGLMGIIGMLIFYSLKERPKKMVPAEP